jgi:pimeloyl-ACP methyl ester carboxylesterase
MLLLADNSENRVNCVASQSAGVCRTAFYLSSRCESLFAWLHTSREGQHIDHGVVICPPIGVEQLHAQRSLRHLADSIATQGIPVLRFDWHGTGDSAGSDADPVRRATWHNNVREVVAWMRRHLDCRKVSVVGLRMGAMVAVEALDADACDNLVLWAPVSCGKAFMRQMRAIEHLAESRARPSYAAAGDVEAGGFLITQETAQQLAQANLLHHKPGCSRVLIVGPCDKRLAEWFARCDVPVDQLSPPGYAEMMAEPHLSQVPQLAIRQITEWLCVKMAPTTDPLTIGTDKLGPVQTLIACRNHGATATACSVRERLLRIGDCDLFGILTEPDGPSHDLPTVVILNAGSASHVGPGRLYVELARHLTAHGFPCVRLDICGLGDSVCPSFDDENDPYPPTVFRDVALTLHELQSRFGVKRCILLGLCSGAYGAFQSAAQLADSSLVESILINPLTFHWRDGMSLDAAVVARQLKENWSIARAKNVGKLWKFLCRKTEIGYLDAARLLLCRAQNYVRQLRVQPARVEELRSIAVAAHPTQENLSADLARIVAAGRRLAVFLAEGDPGYVIMNYHARRQVRAMQRAGTLYVSTIPGGDHPFSRRVPREKLFRSIAEYLLARFAVSERHTS